MTAESMTRSEIVTLLRSLADEVERDAWPVVDFGLATVTQDLRDDLGRRRTTIEAGRRYTIEVRK